MNNEKTPAQTLLIATKLLPPPVPDSLVARPRLTDRLFELVNRRLTTLSASAGFGKTTLLCEWLQRVKADSSFSLSTAWLALDPADNDLVRFWQYVLAALGTLWPIEMQKLSRLLGSGHPLSIDSFLVTLVNELTALTSPPYSRQPTHFVLVLDDYHTIQKDEIHRSMAFLIDYLPPHLHLVIASRVDPPFSLGLLRARNQLLEIHGPDLRFSNDEAAQFLERRMGLSLSAEEVATLQQYVEGWVAGLQLSALSMGKDGDVNRFLKKFDGNDRNVSDFLVAEILNRLPENITRFLLETCILDRFCGSLCDCVTQTDDSQNTIEMLESANLFVIPLDNSRNWYRYQHLVADVLQGRLKQYFPDLAPILHMRASEWYRRKQMPEEAIRHSLAAEDYPMAGALMEQHYRLLISRTSTIFPLFLNAIPPAYLESHPILLIVSAWDMLGQDQPERAEQFIGRAEQAISRLEDEQAAKLSARLQPEMAVIRAIAAGQRNFAINGIQIVRQAFSLVPENDAFLKSMVQYAAGPVYSRSDDLATTIRILNEGWLASQAMQNLNTEMITRYFLANQFIFQGKLHKAKGVLDFTLQRTTEQDGEEIPYSGLARIGMGSLLREWNDLPSALQMLNIGIEKIRSGKGVVFLADGYISMARIKQAEGHSSEGVRILEDTSLLFQQHGAVRGTAEVEAHLARLHLMAGTKQSAFHWAQVCDFSADREDFPLKHIQQTTLARVFAAKGKYDEAMIVLSQLLKQAESAGHFGNLIEILILRALFLNAQRREEQAFQAIQQALEMAEPEGYIRIFADEGQAMVTLLNAYLQAGGVEKSVPPAIRQYCGILLTAIGLPSQEAEEFNIALAASDVDALTGREVEVCRLLLYGYSNQEIAKTLFISENTVHSHRKKIYDKLCVHNRRQLIQKMKN